MARKGREREGKGRERGGRNGEEMMGRKGLDVNRESTNKERGRRKLGGKGGTGWIKVRSGGMEDRPHTHF